MAVRSFVAILAVIGVLSPSFPVHGQGPEWFGTWTLNLEKSVYKPGPAPYRRATMRVEQLDARVRFSYDFVYLRGGVQHLEWDGRFDGRDYIVQGTDEYMTYAYRQTGERTYEIVAKVDTHVAAIATATLSPDGRTLTTITRGTGVRGQEMVNMTVHEKSGGP